MILATIDVWYYRNRTGYCETNTWHVTYTVTCTATYTVTCTATYTVTYTATYTVTCTATYTVTCTAMYTVTSTATYTVTSTKKHILFLHAVSCVLMGLSSLMMTTVLIPCFLAYVSLPLLVHLRAFKFNGISSLDPSWLSRDLMKNKII